MSGGIGSGRVTTGKIADAAVTNAKRAAGSQEANAADPGRGVANAVTVASTVRCRFVVAKVALSAGTGNSTASIWVERSAGSGTYDAVCEVRSTVAAAGRESWCVPVLGGLRYYYEVQTGDGVLTLEEQNLVDL